MIKIHFLTGNAPFLAATVSPATLELIPWIVRTLLRKRRLPILIVMPDGETEFSFDGQHSSAVALKRQIDKAMAEIQQYVAEGNAES